MTQDEFDELQKAVIAFNAGQSGTGGPAAPVAGTPDLKGEAIMKKPAHLLTQADQNFLLAETRRVLAEMKNGS